MSKASLISNTPDQPVPVSVNGIAISPENIAAEAQNHASDRPEKAWAAAAEALVIREALLQKARALGLVAQPVTDASDRKEPEDDALIRQLLEAEVSVPNPDLSSSQRYFENNRGRFRSADLYEVAHILLQADKRDALAYSRAKREAEALIEALQDKPGQFERMARDRSDCPSANDGGRLGQIAAGQTTPLFEAAVREMQPGEISASPVETPYGFHIIRLDQKAPGTVPDFEIARPLVEEFLRDASWRRAVSQFISLVIGEATITGVALNGAKTPLVQ
ncbi:peptidylprolyl isomerase [Hyphobacterium sp.]|uniref:peptidylprolyl isomerase n=1 Tax=Hyphobacterium sp. TaxID=2004662 RepID=UPI003B51DA75